MTTIAKKNGKTICQGQLTFDPFRQLEMDPPIQYSEKESVFLAANLQPRSSVQQWRRKVYHLRNMVSRSLRSLDTMFLRWFEKRAHCLFEKNRGLFFRARRLKSNGKTPLFSRWCCGSGCASFRWCGSETILHAVRLPIDRQDFCVM